MHASGSPYYPWPVESDWQAEDLSSAPGADFVYPCSGPYSDFGPGFGPYSGLGSDPGSGLDSDPGSGLGFDPDSDPDSAIATVQS